MVQNDGEISWWRVDFTDEDICRVADSIRNRHVSMGPVTREFEECMADTLGVSHVVATTNGSTALLLALMAAGIGGGDEVIIPNRTWIATAHAVLMLGAKPVLVDVLEDRPCMDTSKIRERISPRTKAIMPVHLNGRATRMDEVWAIAREFHLLVLEDAAQGLLSKYNGDYLGTLSDAGCFSLAISKLVPTGQGGFVATNRDDMNKKLRLVRTHGMEDVVFGNSFPGMGFNFRYTDLQASIGLVQLGKVEQRINSLMRIYGHYRSGLLGMQSVNLVPVMTEAGEVPIYIEVLCDDREQVVSFLARHNVETRPFYPDLDSAPHLKCSGDFPNARNFSQKGLVLPCGPDQPLENIEVVLALLSEYEASL